MTVRSSETTLAHLAVRWQSPPTPPQAVTARRRLTRGLTRSPPPLETTPAPHWHGDCLIRSRQDIVFQTYYFHRGSLPLSQTAAVSNGRAAMIEDSQAPKTRIVILGGGFGGGYTAHHLEKLCKGRQDVEIVLVSRDNFLPMTPLPFAGCSGTLD